MSDVDCFVWIGPRMVEAAVSVRGAWVDRAAWQGAFSEHSDVTTCLATLAQHWEQNNVLPAGRRALWVGVSETHLASATLPWSPMLWRDALAGSLAQAQLVQAGHDAQTGDVVRWADAPAGEPRLVLGYGASLSASVEALAAKLNARLMSMVSLSALGGQCAASIPWRQHVASTSHQALGLLLDGQAVLIEGLARSPARLLMQNHEDEMLALRTLWARASLRAWSRSEPPGQLDDGGAASLRVIDLRAAQSSLHATPRELDGFAVQAWPVVRPAMAPSPVLHLLRAATGWPTDALDAVARPLRWSRAQRAILAVAVLGLSALVADNFSLWQDRRVALAQVAAVEAPRPTVSRAAPLNRDELQKAQQLNEAVRRLNFPVDALLTALQPPKDIPVSVLSIEMRANAAAMRGVVSVKGQAPLTDDMSRYVLHVGGQSPYQEAHLRLHEQQVALPGQPVVFSMEAAWQQ